MFQSSAINNQIESRLEIRAYGDIEVMNKIRTLIVAGIQRKYLVAIEAKQVKERSLMNVGLELLARSGCASKPVREFDPIRRQGDVRDVVSLEERYDLRIGEIAVLNTEGHNRLVAEIVEPWKHSSQLMNKIETYSHDDLLNSASDAPIR